MLDRTIGMVALLDVSSLGDNMAERGRLLVEDRNEYRAGVMLLWAPHVLPKRAEQEPAAKVAARCHIRVYFDPARGPHSNPADSGKASGGD